METREGFREFGEVALFEDFPTVDTVAETLDRTGGPSSAIIDAILDELAFSMKTATRLGRAIRIGHRWWGHPSTYGSRQMAVADEFERTGSIPEEFDGWAVLDPVDLIALVGLRTGIAAAIVDTVITEFCLQVQSFRVKGVHFRTPARPLGTSTELAAELAKHLDVLQVHDHDVTLVGYEVPIGAAGQADVLARYADGGWLVIHVYTDAVDPVPASQLARCLDAISDQPVIAGEPVRGLVITDGYAQDFVEAVMRDERVMHLNLRCLDLPSCGAQRWAIRERGTPVGWVAVAADGRTVVNGAGDGFTDVALVEPFECIPLDFERFRMTPLPVGDRSTPGVSDDRAAPAR